MCDTTVVLDSWVKAEAGGECVEHAQSAQLGLGLIEVFPLPTVVLLLDIEIGEILVTENGWKDFYLGGFNLLYFFFCQEAILNAALAVAVLLLS